MSSRWPPLSKSNEPDLKLNMLLTSVLGVKRSISHWHLAIAAIIASLVAVLPDHSRVVTAVEPVDEIIAYVVEGTGNGHGRGLSQWGAYGWAVEHGWEWEQILDHYYGGTVMGDIDPNQRIRVRLTDFDGSSWMGVTSASSSASWSSPDGSGTGVSAIKVAEVAANQFDIYIGDGLACPGASTLSVPDGPISTDSTEFDAVRMIQTFLTAFGWDPNGIDGDFGPQTESAVRAYETDEGLTVDGVWDIGDATRARELIAAATSTIGWGEPIRVSGPVIISTTVDESLAEPGDVLGLCSGSGAVTHYRGSLELRDTSSGNRVINEVSVENYLRGVVPREVSASWGDRGDRKSVV